MLLAAFCFALMGACTKWLGRKFSSVELVFFRNLLGILFLMPTFWQKPLQQEGGKLKLLLLRGLVGSLSLFCFYYSMTKIQLGLANTYNLTYPIFMGFIAGVWLRKPLSKTQWLCIVFGFLGVLCIFRPDVGVPLRNHFIGLFSGCATAIAYLAVNELSKVYDNRIIISSFMIFGLIFSVISMLLGAHYQNPALDFMLAPFIMPNGIEWIWIFVLGVVALLGQIFLTRALQFGDPATVSPINYMQIPFSLMLGYWLGDRSLDGLSWLGIAFIIASGAWITIKNVEMKNVEMNR